MSLSILTRPVVDVHRLPETLHAPLFVGGKHLIKQGYSWVSRRNCNLVSRYGHPAVTGSLIDGLKSTGEPFRYNVFLSSSLTSQVGVLAGAATLASVLNLDRSSELSIMAGPNLTTAPSEIAHLYADPRVKLVLVPSLGVARAYWEDLPDVAHKVRVWSAGVDTDYWSPGLTDSTNPQITLYIKNDWSNVADELTRVLMQSGFRVCVIRYGNYRPSQFRAALQSSIALVYLGATESQCIAQFEAWACNVPTFVHALPSSMELGSSFPEIKGANNLSAAPYLSSDTGSFWSSLDECLFQVCQTDASDTKPRRWVLENASLTESAKNYLRLASELSTT